MCGAAAARFGTRPAGGAGESLDSREGGCEGLESRNSQLSRCQAPSTVSPSPLRTPAVPGGQRPAVPLPLGCCTNGARGHPAPRSPPATSCCATPGGWAALAAGILLLAAAGRPVYDGTWGLGVALLEASTGSRLIRMRSSCEGEG